MRIDEATAPPSVPEAVVPSQALFQSIAKPGRPWSFDRARALGVAMELFWRHGYEGVSIARLTEAMGIAPPSLYAAFGSKADLFREAVALYEERAKSGAAMVTEASALRAVEAMLRDGVRGATQPSHPRGCMISSGLLAAGPEHADLAEDLRRRRASTREVLRARIQDDVYAGRLPRGTDADGLARFYASVLQGISVQARDGATADELGAVVDAALRAWPNEAGSPESSDGVA